MRPHPPPDQRSDSELIDAANRGDARAFECLYLRYRDWAMVHAQRCTGDADDACDVVQESFLYLLGKFPGFQLTAKMTTFLYPVIQNTARRVREKRRFRTEIGVAELDSQSANPGSETAPWRSTTALSAAAEPSSEGTASPSAAADTLSETTLRRRALEKAISNLGDDHREVVLLRFVDDMKISQIADLLRLPAGTVKSRLHYALAELRRNPRLRTYFDE